MFGAAENHREEDAKAAAMKDVSPDLPKKIGRYQVFDRLGRGGMGEVYRVWDPARGRELAVKVLKEANPTALQYFKREFRTIAHFSHPNLVQLHELHFDRGRYFYTMELINGMNLYVHVNGSKRILRKPEQLLEPARLKRLRHGVVQLLRALAYLHDNRCIHRDIKPSNVMVNGEEIVKLLDFGIVKEVDVSGPEDSLSQVFGTAIYMSPEQSLGVRTTPAVDLYATGIVLYELLAGVPPFQGSDQEVIRKHHTDAPPPLAELLPDVPDELAALCMALLAKSPEERPGAREALEQLGAPLEDEGAPEEIDLVGRRAQRKLLATALDAVHKGRGQLVVITGASGSGKTALLKTFAAEARLYSASSFIGACIEHDHVPARGLDTVIERLASAYRRQAGEILLKMPGAQRGPLLRLFPFLRDLLPEEQATRLRRPADRRTDRAGQALKTLLTKLGDRRLLVLAIEDINAADELTVNLLEGLLEGGNLPPVMVIVTLSPELAPHHVRRLLELITPHPDVTGMTLGPLDPDECRQLLHEQVGAVSAETSRQAYEETGGDPLFVMEMVRHLKCHPNGDLPKLDALLAEHVASLPSPAQRLLAAMAISRNPVPATVLSDATGLTADVLADAIDGLVVDGFVTTYSDKDAEFMVARTHPRLMGVARNALGPRIQRAIHGKLARAYEATGGSPLAVEFHWRAAETPEKAGEYALDAARAADAAGNFDRASELWEVALSTEAPGADARTIVASLIESRTRAGRYEEAAWAIDQLISIGPSNATAWLTRQGELFLMSGNLTAFSQRVEALPPGASRVRLADLLAPFDPFRAEALLGPADSDEARLVQIRLLAGENRARSVSRAMRLFRKIDAGFPNDGLIRAASYGVTHAAVLAAEGNPREAERVLDQAIEPFEHQLVPTDVVGLRVQICRVELALAQGRLAEARAGCRPLVQHARERMLPGFIAWSCELQAKLHIEAGELHAADLVLDEAAEHWPPDPPSQPNVRLKLARARRMIYGGEPQSGLALMRELQADINLRAFLGRRALTAEATLLAARARASMAARAWRAGMQTAAETSRTHLLDVLKPLKRVLPTPDRWIDVLSAIADLVAGHEGRAIARLSEWVEAPGNPVTTACAAHVLAAAKDARRRGDGRNERRRAESLLRDAHAAPPPEATALGP